MQIGIVAPASPVSEKDIRAGINWFKQNSYTVKLGNNIYKAERFMAGTDAERANDINTMFADDTVDAIIAARGGYGSGRILPFIDYEMVKKHKKPFIGLSDTTALQTALYTKSQLPSYTGAVLKTDFVPDITKRLANSILAALQHKKQKYENLTCLHSGKTSGEIIGGNLTMLLTLAGTEYFPDFTDKILFIEDINEQPFRIDRMLNSLFLLGVFDKIKGIIIGDFTAELKFPEDGTIDDVFNERFGKLGIPVVTNFLNGHIRDKYLLKIGSQVILDADKGELYEI